MYDTISDIISLLDVKWFCISPGKRVAYLGNGFYITLQKHEADDYVEVTVTNGTENHIPAHLFDMRGNILAHCYSWHRKDV